MIKRIFMPALMLALVAFGSMEAKENQTECRKTECSKQEASCSKSEGKCCKKEASCSKSEGKCCKKEASCSKDEGKCCKKDGTCVNKEAKGNGKTKESNDTTVVFSVEPKLVCHNCENRVKNELRFEKGIKRIDASAEEQRVTVTFDRRKSDVSKLKEAFAKIGYKAESKE